LETDERLILSGIEHYSREQMLCSFSNAFTVLARWNIKFLSFTILKMALILRKYLLHACKKDTKSLQTAKVKGNRLAKRKP